VEDAKIGNIEAREGGKKRRKAAAAGIEPSRAYRLARHQPAPIRRTSFYSMRQSY
jgi:hypothetical protein